MASSNFTVRAIPPHEALRHLADIAAALYPTGKCSLILDTAIRDNHIDSAEMGVKSLLNEPPFKQALELLESKTYIACRKLRIASLPHNGTLEFKPALEDVVAHVIVSFNDNAHAAEATRCAEEISKRFSIVNRHLLAKESLPTEWRDNLRYYETALNDLNAAVSSLGKTAAEQIARQSKFFEEKNREIDLRLTAKEQELQSRFDHREKEVKERERVLSDRVAAFETRESKYVRRDLLERMQGMIADQKEISLSQKTGRKRWIIHGVCLATAILCIVLISVFAPKLLTSTQFEWHLFAPLSTALITFVVTTVYYLRWNNSWFSQHAQAEFRNMRFAADVLRASWLAELLFEWTKEKETPFPDALLRNFAANIFTEPDSEAVKHPTEDLAALLGQITKVRVAGEGVEITRKPK